ncbi:MAG: zinc-ribbon domain-containing protein [Labilithrix sp.]|nr:zinc-ribbon domain-containing protein [Labilithrix sp.]MCW5813848.1 zinc-ribbon domain-containing protein [Labilithrix sp.]
MDVKCERCNTEYEFDDALVSGRGTTVKCTNCGHKFKIRREGGDVAADYWNVTTGDGRTLVFTSLRELQRAIQGYLVERTDRLSRGGLPPKAIGQIPELAPFFDQREAAKRGQSPARSSKTQDGLGPAAAAQQAQAQGQVRPRQLTKPEFPGPPPSSEPIEPIGGAPGKATLIGTGPLSNEEAIPRPGPVPAPPRPPPVKSTPPPVPVRAGREPMHTVPIKRPSVPSVPSIPPPLPEKARSAPPTPPPAGTRTNPPPPVRTNPPPPAPPPPEPVKVSAPPPRARSLLAEIEEERDRRTGYESVPELPVAKARRPVGGFIVAVVVIAGLLGVGAFWARNNGILAGPTKPVASAPVADPRVAGLLVSGEKALADGNLDLAKESFDKASVLAEKDPHVLLARARLAAARADLPWLKQRLLSPDAADEQRIAKGEVIELAAAAKKAADDALAVAPDDPASVRAKVDALRIEGDRDGARALAVKIAGSASQPEAAYVLAALDLTDPEPPWTQLVEKLKTASSVETGPGRGRAALVYALTLSGDVAGAKAEVDRLNAMPRPHPLLPLLRAFADRAKPAAGKGDAGIVAAATEPKPGPSGAAPAPAQGGGGGGVPADPREMLAQAERARAKGDLERARTLYNAAIDKNPNDSEALNGLALLAYQQKDLPAARTAYKRVLAINPNYMPALIGLADVEWESGDHATASKMYKEIVDTRPEGTYPARVKQRSES